MSVKRTKIIRKKTLRHSFYKELINIRMSRVFND